MPEDGHCYDCGSSNITRSGDAKALEQTLVEYNTKKEELLSFYNHHGLLVDEGEEPVGGDASNVHHNISSNSKVPRKC